jgi:hypothetical protein
MTSRTIIGLTSALATSILLTACGGTSTAPSPPPPANITGNWSGTFQYSNNTGLHIDALVMNLSQAGTSVSGTWSTNGRDGTVSGSTTPTNFSGTLTYHTTSTTGGACTGTFAASGDAGSTTMTWTSPAVTENCTNAPTSITIAVQLR